ncbi:MAG: diacylglycerol kinase family protein [Acidimicrobiia bacterium]
MTVVGVIAHERKSVGGGLPELRTRLAEQGFNDPFWRQLSKSKQSPAAVRELIDEGVTTLFTWGGDGTVQRTIDAVVAAGAGDRVDLAVVPAGTANLFAHNLSLPIGDVAAAVDVGLNGHRSCLDVGKVNGEHFAVMAGIGFDAAMIKGADRSLKDRVGRLAYLWTGAKSMTTETTKVVVEVDGAEWFRGKAGCVMCGNVGTLMGGVTAFPNASPFDGRLDIAVVQAGSTSQWTRVLARLAAGDSVNSPLIAMTAGRKLVVRLDEALPYELDGGARGTTHRFKARVVPGAITVRTPVDALRTP